MKIIVFDVGNAACSVVSSPNKHGMMIDCGSNSEKTNPVELFATHRDWLEIAPFITSKKISYDLGLLHITHPDDDHVRNAKKIKDELPPYLLLRRRYEEFPKEEQINNDYKENIDKEYRGSNGETIEWGFDENITWRIPMDTLKSDEELSKKLKNNSSILRYVSYFDTKVLFAGDMEKEGWAWLKENNKNFVNTMKKGLDILIAPHHGHKSGFPKEIFELTGNVRVVIHSKGSEGSIEGTDVSTQYSSNSDGTIYNSLNDKLEYKGKVLTTRSNGNIYISILPDGFIIWTDKASPNHEKASAK